MRKNPHPTTKQDHVIARCLRHEASPVESRFWKALSQAVKNTNLKFRRQQPIHPYIVDFACMKAKLLIELDGPSHDARTKEDQVRDDYLKDQGYTVLRISNREAISNPDGVIETILRQAENLSSDNAKPTTHPLTCKN